MARLRLLAWLGAPENELACLLALGVLGLHLAVIHRPDELMFDELHYVPQARHLLDGVPLIRVVHPALGKLFIAGGIYFFGDDPFGWRIFPVLFGVASILLFYLMCQKLTTRRYVPLLATYVFAFSNMAFVQSAIAMLDVFSVTFMLASFLCYLHRRPVAAGIFVALAATVKLTGALAGLVILGHWLVTNRRLCTDMVRFAAAAAVGFLLIFMLCDFLSTGRFIAPWDRLRFLLEQSFSLTTHTVDDSRITPPWDWIVFPCSMWYSVDGSYKAALNWDLWVLIFPLMGYMIYRARRDMLCSFSLAWFVGTYLIWWALEPASDRITFIFYFYPAVGAVCLAAAYALGDVWRFGPWRLVAVAWMLTHLAVFLVMGPLV